MSGEQGKKRGPFIDCLKCIACLFITNSHCREIYPVYYLAVGGGWGNILFFLVSGFCYSNVNDSFGKWYKKRLFRILPAMAVMEIFNIVCHHNEIFAEGMSAGTFIDNLLDSYWFVFALLLYDILYYFLFRYANTKIIAMVLAVWGIIYALIYIFLLDTSVFCVELGGFSSFKVYFYFSSLIIGGLLRKYSHKLREIFDSGRRLGCLFGLQILSMVVWGGIYGLMFAFQKAYRLQFMIQVCVLIFGVSTFLIFMGISKKIKYPGRVAEGIVLQISGATLEIYLVQITFASAVRGFGFPVNWLIFLAIAFLGGIGFRKGMLFLTSTKIPFCL